MASNPKSVKYSKSENTIPVLTPSQWEKQNLSKGYVEHPGYKLGKKKVDTYKEFYDPSTFSPKLTEDGIYQWSNLKDPNYDFSAPENIPVQRYEPPKVNISPETDPSIKPLQFTPNYTLNPNTGIATLPNGQLVDPTIEYKNGGLVKKARKKYANGGSVTPEQAATFGVGINAVSDLGEGITGYNAERKAYRPVVDPLSKPEYIQQTKNSQLGKGIGSAAGAGLGLAAGSTLAVLTGGAAAPLIPAITGLGSKVGSLTGKAIGTSFDRKNSKSQLDKDQADYESAVMAAENEAKFQTNLANQLSTRNSYSKGGKIVGKGTGTSDSIKAKIKEDSHIIPKKNAKIAEAIRETILEEPKEKEASLNQSGGTDVKLSNGEHLFSPEEVKEIEAHGIDLDDLSPDAEHGDDEMNKGGLTPAKAKIILHDGTIRGKKITDKQRKFFGAVSNGYKCGGKVKGYADGGEVEDPFKTIRERQIKAQRDSDLKELKDLSEQYRELKRKSTSSNPIERAEYNRNIVQLAERMKQISDKQSLSTKSLPTKTGEELNKLLKEPVVKSNLGKVAASKSSLSDPAQSSLNRAMANQDVDNSIVVPPSEVTTGIAKSITSPTNAIDDAANRASYDADMAARLAETAPKKNNTAKNILGGVSTAINYGLPIAQTALGLKYLKKSGQRPVDQIDPIFQTTLNDANTRATYGFTPEEQALLNNQNNNLTSAQRFAARNYSGGSAGNAYAMERTALNDAYGRGLSNAVQNRELQLNKKQYADQLGLNKVELSRRLFNDKLAAWQQQQQAGQNLLGTGLGNLVAANRYEQEKRAIADNNAIQNNWLNSI